MKKFFGLVLAVLAACGNDAAGLDATHDGGVDTILASDTKLASDSSSADTSRDTSRDTSHDTTVQPDAISQDVPNEVRSDSATDSATQDTMPDTQPSDTNSEQPALPDYVEYALKYLIAVPPGVVYRDDQDRIWVSNKKMLLQKNCVFTDTWCHQPAGCHNLWNNYGGWGLGVKSGSMTPAQILKKKVLVDATVTTKLRIAGNSEQPVAIEDWVKLRVDVSPERLQQEIIKANDPEGRCP